MMMKPLMKTESYAHLHTKQWLAEHIRAAGNCLKVWLTEDEDISQWLVDVTGLRPVVECAYPGGESVLDSSDYFAKHGHYPEMIFDVGLVDDKGVPVGAFEIVKSNPLSEEKITKLLKRKIFCFEVDAFEFCKDVGYIETGRIDARKLVITKQGRKRVEYGNRFADLRVGVSHD